MSNSNKKHVNAANIKITTIRNIPIIAENGFSFFAGKNIPAIVKNITENTTDNIKYPIKEISLFHILLKMHIGIASNIIYATCDEISKI
jgi:hypothetical protein